MSRRRPEPVEDRRTGNPAAQLRADLARFRAAGRSFDEAWRVAYLRIKWPHLRVERDMWKALITADRHRFEAAYYGMPQPRSVEVLGRIEAA